jgi:LysR family transcriptional repressor of citA
MGGYRLDIRWIKTFIIAAKYENFRKTSEELFLTQPAITKHVRRLEDSLNIQLFERIGKKVTLTPAGHKFLRYAKEIIIKYDQRMDDFNSWKQGYNRKLIIATAPQIASSVLPSLLRSFINENQDIEVIVNVLKSHDIGEEISVGKADLGLTRIQPVQTNINIDIVHQEPVILVGPNDDKEENIFNEEEVLNRYRLMTYNHPDYWDNLLNDLRRHYPSVRTMVVNQVEITKRFIKEGLGVSYLPLTMVKEEIRMNELVEIKPDRISPPQSATYMLTKVETDEVILFNKFLREAIAEL